MILIPPGNYYWYGTIEYSSAQVSGSYSFDGDIIIEKGKIMHITLEDLNGEIILNKPYPNQTA